jgi:hypothetical protein
LPGEKEITFPVDIIDEEDHVLIPGRNARDKERRHRYDHFRGYHHDLWSKKTQEKKTLDILE